MDPLQQSDQTTSDQTRTESKCNCTVTLIITIAVSTIAALVSTLVLLHSKGVVTLPLLPPVEVLVPSITTSATCFVIASLISCLIVRLIGNNSAEHDRDIEMDEVQSNEKKLNIDYANKLPDFVENIRIHAHLTPEQKADLKEKFDRIATTDAYSKEDFHGLQFPVLPAQPEAECIESIKSTLEILAMSNQEFGELKLTDFNNSPDQTAFDQFFIDILFVRGILYQRGIKNETTEIPAQFQEDMTIEQFFKISSNQLADFFSSTANELNSRIVKTLKRWVRSDGLKNVEFDVSYFSLDLHRSPLVRQWDQSRLNELGAKKFQQSVAVFQRFPAILSLVENPLFESPEFQAIDFGSECVNVLLTDKLGRLENVSLDFINRNLRFLSPALLKALPKKLLGDEGLTLLTISKKVLQEAYSLPKTKEEFTALRETVSCVKNPENIKFLFSNFKPEQLALLSHDQFRIADQNGLNLSAEQYNSIQSTLKIFDQQHVLLPGILLAIGPDNTSNLLASNQVADILSFMPETFFAADSSVVLPEEGLSRLIEIYVSPYTGSTVTPDPEKEKAAQAKMRVFKNPEHVKKLIQNIDGKYVALMAKEQFDLASGSKLKVATYNEIQKTLQYKDKGKHITILLRSLGIENTNHLLNSDGVNELLSYIPEEHRNSQVFPDDKKKIKELFKSYLKAYLDARHNYLKNNKPIDQELYKAAQYSMRQFTNPEHLKIFGKYFSSACLALFSNEQFDALHGIQLSAKKFNNLCDWLKINHEENRLPDILKRLGAASINHLLKIRDCKEILRLIPDEVCKNEELELPSGDVLKDLFKSAYPKFPKEYVDVMTNEEEKLYNEVKAKVQLFTSDSQILTLYHNLDDWSLAMFSFEQLRRLADQNIKITKDRWTKTVNNLAFYKRGHDISDIFKALGVKYLNEYLKMGIPIKSQYIPTELEGLVIPEDRIATLFEFSYLMADDTKTYDIGQKVMNSLHEKTLRAIAPKLSISTLALLNEQKLKVLNLDEKKLHEVQSKQKDNHDHLTKKSSKKRFLIKT